MKSVNDRIKKVREHFCDDNNLKFAEILDVTPQYASNITKNGKSVGYKVFDNILSKFPNINPNWLKMGEGEMIKNSQHLENTKSSFAVGRDVNGSEIHITNQHVEDFIKITNKYQEQTDRMLLIIEKLIEK
jgi:hypothetical protein